MPTDGLDLSAVRPSLTTDPRTSTAARGGRGVPLMPRCTHRRGGPRRSRPSGRDHEAWVAEAPRPGVGTADGTRCGHSPSCRRRAGARRAARPGESLRPTVLAVGLRVDRRHGALPARARGARAHRRLGNEERPDIRMAWPGATLRVLFGPPAHDVSRAQLADISRRAGPPDQDRRAARAPVLRRLSVRPATMGPTVRVGWRPSPASPCHRPWSMLHARRHLNSRSAPR